MSATKFVNLHSSNKCSLFSNKHNGIAAIKIFQLTSVIKIRQNTNMHFALRPTSISANMKHNPLREFKKMLRKQVVEKYEKHISFQTYSFHKS